MIEPEDDDGLAPEDVEWFIISLFATWGAVAALTIAFHLST